MFVLCLNLEFFKTSSHFVFIKQIFCKLLKAIFIWFHLLLRNFQLDVKSPSQQILTVQIKNEHGKIH